MLPAEPGVVGVVSELGTPPAAALAPPALLPVLVPKKIEI